LIQAFLHKLREYFIQCSRFHLRPGSVGSVRELVDLFDRFLDGSMRYDLEWDDFISWEASNPQVEQIRNRIGEHEILLFSGDQRNRELYANYVVEERNRIAALLNIPLRPKAHRYAVNPS